MEEEIPAPPSKIPEPVPANSKYKEGQVLSINYTAAGPVKVVWRDGKQRVESPQPDPDPEVPGGISKKELSLFFNFCALTDELLKPETRKVPVLLREAEQIIAKPAIKNMARKGLIDIQTLVMVNDDKKKQSYAFCWLTSLGLGIKVQFDLGRKSVTEPV